MIQYIANILYSVLVVLVVGNVLIAYFPQWRYHPVGELIYNCSEPLLQPIRRVIPPIQTGSGSRLDISPAICLFVAFLIVEAIDMGLGVQMR